MDVPGLSQATTAKVGLIPQLGRDGDMVLVVVMKQLFQVDRRDVVHRIDGAEVRFADVMWDEDAPEKSSVKYPSDVCIRKPSTDVVVVGSAEAPYLPRVKQLDVLVRVGPVKKLLRVFGTRVWYRGVTTLALSPPEPFQTQPVRWEYAFGGYDDSDPTKPIEEPRNPVGRGLARDRSTLVDQPGPSVEDPTDLITNDKSRPAPAGVGALGRHWMPRRQYVGTIDDLWKKERMPLLPLDFDERYNQLATPELIAPAPLRGGEPAEIVNMSALGSLRFELPRIAFHVGATFDDKTKKEYRSMLDTVVVMPTDRRLEMTWRTALLVPRPARKLRSIEVHEKTIL
jgi:hypothetical protein